MPPPECAVRMKRSTSTAAAAAGAAFQRRTRSGWVPACARNTGVSARYASLGAMLSPVIRISRSAFGYSGIGSILLRSSKAVVPAKAGTTVEASARILLESQQRSNLLEGALTRGRGYDRLPDLRGRRCRAAIRADLPQRQARL